MTVSLETALSIEIDDTERVFDGGERKAYIGLSLDGGDAQAAIDSGDIVVYSVRSGGPVELSDADEGGRFVRYLRAGDYEIRAIGSPGSGFCGTEAAMFSVGRLALDSGTVQFTVADVNCQEGQECTAEPKVTVRKSRVTLEKGIDYDVRYCPLGGGEVYDTVAEALAASGEDPFSAPVRLQAVGTAAGFDWDTGEDPPDASLSTVYSDIVDSPAVPEEGVPEVSHREYGLRVEFRILPPAAPVEERTDLRYCKVVSDIPDFEYAAPDDPVGYLELEYGENRLVRGVDYEYEPRYSYSYPTEGNRVLHNVTIMGLGDFTSSRSFEYEVMRFDWLDYDDEEAR